MSKTNDRFKYLTKHCNLNGKGLEFGPSYNPVCPKKDGFDIEVVDWLNQKDLKERYKNELSKEQLNNIEEVDYVWKGQSYCETIGKIKYYDYILSSNMIEHVTDFIGYLNDCEQLIKDNGTISLAIPDKRFCFDYYRPLTSIAEVIDRHEDINKDKHSLGSVIEYELNTVKSNQGLSWNFNNHDELSSMCPVGDEKRIKNKIVQAKEGEFCDIHDWVFTPSSFRLLMKDLFSLGYINLVECGFHTTPNDKYEFYVSLKIDREAERIINQQERIKLLEQIDYETKEITAFIPKYQNIKRQQPAIIDNNLVDVFNNSSSNNRLVIFTLFNNKKRIERYVLYYLQSLKEVCDDIAIIINGDVNEKDYLKLKTITDKIYKRINKGFDFGAWKDAINKLIGIDKIREYDELILCNDTVYGPLYKLDNIFEEMKDIPVDFWGISAMPQWYGDTGLDGNCLHDAHIQSFFTVFRKRILESEDFISFWKFLPYPKNHAEAVTNCEIYMSKYFFDLGYSWDSYVKSNEFYTDPYREYIPYLSNHYHMIKDLKMPFVKRNIFSIPKNQVLQLNDGNDAKQTLKYIEEETLYDTDFIWDDLLRNRNIRDIYESLHLDYVINETNFKGSDVNKKIALFMHIFYLDSLEYSINHALNVPESADIIITTDSKLKAIKIKEAFDKAHRYVKEIKVVKNRGRELKALLVDCKTLISNYDYLCFIHDKKSPQDIKPAGEAYRDVIFNSLLGSKKDVNYILGLFEGEKRLGLLGAPRPLHSGYINSLGHEWINEFKMTKDLLSKCNVDVILDESKHPFVLGSCFWCRSIILKKLIEANLTEEDFTPEPMPVTNTISHAIERSFEYLAADSGFYSALVMTNEYASIRISEMNYMLSNSNIYHNTARQAQTESVPIGIFENNGIKYKYICFPSALWKIVCSVFPSDFRKKIFTYWESKSNSNKRA